MRKVLLLSLVLFFVLISVSSVRAKWWNNSYPFRYKIISNSTAEFPVSVNDTYGICGNIIWALIGNDSYLYCEKSGCCGGKIAIATETHEKYWEDESSRTGNNPNSVWDSNYMGVWHFGESSSNASDSTNNNNDATTTNITSYSVTGTFGNAFDFEKESSNFIYVPDTASLDFQNHSFTVEAWIKLESNQWMTIVDKYWDESNRGYALYVLDDNAVRLLIGDSSGNDNVGLSSFDTLVKGKWYYIVATWNTTTAKIYINGTLDNSVNGALGPSANSEQLNIGVSWNSFGGYFDGIKDEYRILNRTLTDEEIETMYLNGINQLTRLGKEELICYSDIDCDDSNECTIDTCVNPGTDESYCSYSNIDCSYLNEQCQVGVCDPSDGQCYPDYSNHSLSTPCEADELFCTVDHCDGLGSCVYWKNYNCSDTNDCTDDICNENLDKCENPNLPDGTNCTGDEPHKCCSGICDTDGTTDGQCSVGTPYCLAPGEWGKTPAIDNNGLPCGGILNTECNISSNCTEGYFHYSTCNFGYCNGNSTRVRNVSACNGIDCGRCCSCSSGNRIYNETQDLDCPICQECSYLDTCSDVPSGTDLKNDCGLGCQKCVNGSCQDWDDACSPQYPIWGDYLGICGWQRSDPQCISDACDDNPDYQENCNPYVAYDDNTACWATGLEYCSQTCGAECDEDDDCSEKCENDVRYYNEFCLPNCNCSWSSTENCNDHDEWHNTSEIIWEPINDCTWKKHVKQEYRDYYCSETPLIDCYYISTGETRWIYEIVYKTNGTECGSFRVCPPDACNGNKTEFYPDGSGHDYCNGLGTCVNYCAMEDSHCSDNDPDDGVPYDGVNGLTCGAECDQNSDCVSGLCLDNCTCAILPFILSPNPLYAEKKVTATIERQTGYAGKTVYIGRGQYRVTVCWCTIAGDGCSCSFTSPKLLNTESIETYYARIDKNGDKDYNEPGEEYSQDLTIYCKANGQSCTSDYTCCAGSYCISGTCKYPSGPGGPGARPK